MRVVVHCMLLLVLVGGAVLVNGQSHTVHQNRTAHWIFGDGYHLHFQEDGPVLQPALNHYVASEGASCISDLQGNLLFYSNTQQVWNSAHEVLLNSEGINSLLIPGFGSSLTQGSIFLPLPNDTADRFFVLLHMDDYENKLYYSLIDRELDGGLGGIVPGKKRMETVLGQVSEQLTAVRHANGQDWWVVFVSSGNSITNRRIVSVLLTDSGITKYNECQIMDNFDLATGQLVASDDGEYLILASQEHYGYNHYISYYTFDRCYGEISFLDSINLQGNPQKFYGAGFGYENNIMFVTAGPGIQLFRLIYDGNRLIPERIFNGVTENRSSYMASSLAKWNDCLYYTNSVIAPFPFLDSLVYYLSRVCFSEQFESGFALQPYFLNLGERNFEYSLPNFPNYDLGPLVGSPCDTLSPQDTTQVGLPALPAIPAWTWLVTPTVSGSSFQVSTSQPAALTVHDLFGRERLRMECAGQCVFDLKEQAAGWYVVSLTDRSGRRSEARKVLWQP